MGRVGSLSALKFLMNEEDMSNKVIIEVTEDGFKTKVEYNGEVFKSESVSTGYGAKALDSNLDPLEEINLDLHEAVCGFTQLDIMSSLRSY